MVRDISVGKKSVRQVNKVNKSRESKEGSKDASSWVKGQRPFK